MEPHCLPVLDFDYHVCSCLRPLNSACESLTWGSQVPAVGTALGLLSEAEMDRGLWVAGWLADPRE